MRLKKYVIVSAKDILKGYDLGNNRHPPNSFAYKHAQECEAFLREKGFEEIHATDSKFPYLNILANFAFYSGCLRKNVKITEEEKVLEGIDENIIPSLGLEGEIKPSKRGKRKPTLQLKECGGYMARVIEKMGVPKNCGRKSKLPSLEIPRYRQELFYFADRGELNENNKEIVRRLERDSTAVLFSTRLYPLSKNSLYLYFFARPTEEKAKDFANESIKLINFAVPEIGLTEEDIKLARNQSGSHATGIFFKDDKLECILDGNRELLKFHPKIQELYGFDLDFKPARTKYVYIERIIKKLAKKLSAIKKTT